MELTLKGEKRIFEDGMNALDIAGQISQDLKKRALAARLDGELIELVTPDPWGSRVGDIGFQRSGGSQSAAPYGQPCFWLRR